MKIAEAYAYNSGKKQGQAIANDLLKQVSLKEPSLKEPSLNTAQLKYAENLAIANLKKM